MKARILDPQAKVYSSMDTSNLSIATLQEGNEVELSGMKKKAGKVWFPVTLTTGQKAYIPGETHIFVIREGALMQNSVELHSEPSSESPIKQQLNRNTKVSILQVVKTSDKDWVRVRDVSGNEGYILGDTRVRLMAQKTKANGRRSMITGAMWLVAGIVFLLSGNPTAPSSSFSLLGIAALLFGAIILISGVVQYVTAPA